jgi:hypothetical protein
LGGYRPDTDMAAANCLLKAARFVGASDAMDVRSSEGSSESSRAVPTSSESLGLTRRLSRRTDTGGFETRPYRGM